MSHQVAPPGPPAMVVMSLRRNDRSTAFLSHWLTVQPPSSPRSATLALPLSRRSSAASTASRISPLVVGETASRFSKAASIVLCRASLINQLQMGGGRLVGCRLLRWAGGAVNVGARDPGAGRLPIAIRLARKHLLEKRRKIVGDMMDVVGRVILVKFALRGMVVKR